MCQIEQGSTVVPTLIKRLEALQEEYQVLVTEREEIKKDRPSIPRISQNLIVEKVRMLKSVIQDPSASNKERRLMVRYFVRQMRFFPETGEVEVYFWPNPAEDKDRLRLINMDNTKKDEKSSFMF